MSGVLLWLDDLKHFYVASPVMYKDQTESMVLALQLYNVYRESPVGFTSKKSLAGERIAFVSPILVAT